MTPEAATSVEVDGRVIQLRNLDKVLYPDTGFTKAQVIDYYTRVAPALLPHLSRRPLTLKRYPNGVDGQFFFEKNCPSHRPDWVAVAPIWSGSSRRTIEYCLADDLPTLVWLANLAALELHASLSLEGDADRPTVLVFDLDPGAPADILDCAQVAVWVRDLLVDLGLTSFAKTSGSKGLQLYVPLNTAVSYRETKPFANAVARLLEREHPDRVVSSMNKQQRTGKVFIDWSQNDPHKTTVSVYSLRARERPTVSAPVSWEEVEAALARQDRAGLDLDAPAVVGRLEQGLASLFGPVAELVQELPALPAS